MVFYPKTRVVHKYLGLCRLTLDRRTFFVYNSNRKLSLDISNICIMDFEKGSILTKTTTKLSVCFFSNLKKI